MEYKKIIKKRETRFFILRLMKFIPDSVMLKLQYRIKLGRKLNLKNPKRFTEKIQIYKMKYRNPLMHECVDKYQVRKYIESKGLGDNLVKFYGVYKNVDEIEISELPNSFIAKVTSGGGGNNIYPCYDRMSLDLDDFKSKLTSWMSNIYTNAGREWAYTGLKNKIIIEELLIDENQKRGINDYKFFCFHGSPVFLVVDTERYTNHKRNYFDLEFNELNLEHDDCEKSKKYIPKPTKLNEMIKISEILSKDFPFVRVDLYETNGHVYFGELTFYPWSGYVNFVPIEFDYEIGKFFDVESLRK